MDEHVLRGNAAIIKCHIPSFVAEFVLVDSWLEDEATEIYPGRDYGTIRLHRLQTLNTYIHTDSFTLFFYLCSFVLLSSRLIVRALFLCISLYTSFSALPRREEETSAVLGFRIQLQFCHYVLFWFMTEPDWNLKGCQGQFRNLNNFAF